MNPVRQLFSRRRLHGELSEEIREHLEEKVEELVAGGMPREEAEIEARREFGNVTLVEERGREVWAWPWLENGLRDIRYGLRGMAKSPGFTTVAVLTLALGIGANTAIFSLINAIMLKTLPVKEPERLVLAYDRVNDSIYTGRGFHADIFSNAGWEYFRDHNEWFESLCAFRQGTDRVAMRLPGSAIYDQARGRLVSGSYFKVFGVRAAVGRVLREEDDREEAPAVAVMSDIFWQRRFNREVSAVGRTVNLNGTVFTIVGVAPQGFLGERVETPPDFWLPLARQPQVMQRESYLSRQDAYFLNLLGRLKGGVTLEQAQAALDAQLHQFYGPAASREERREMDKTHVALKPGGRGISWMRVNYSEPLRLLTGVVALVLLICCANLATLLAARGSARRRELFMRLALGASRGRLVRQLVTESVLLALAGGALGAVLAWWSMKSLAVLVRMAPVVDVAPDRLVLAFTLGLSILTGIGFGLAPALRSSRMEAIKARFRPARALVVAQVALSFLLLAGAGVLLRSLVALQSVDPGYRRENLLLVHTDPRVAGYRKTELFGLYQRIQERLNGLPGVISASIAHHSPLSGSSSSGNFSMENYTPPAGRRMQVFMDEVGPQFFETLEIPLVLGRGIGPRDTPASPPVAVVNETFVRQYLRGENPLGRHFSLGAPFEPPGVEIVGVAADSKFYRLRDAPKPMAFFSAWQSGGREAFVGELLIRTQGNAAGTAAEARRALAEIDSRLPIQGVTTLREQADSSLRQERMLTTLCGVFGLLALLLVAIGLYGTVAYSVARRRNEIGVRIALGAGSADVLGMVLREAVLLVVAGLALGFPLVLGGTRWIGSFLFGVSPLDPAAVGAAVGVMLAVAALAGFVPARRATRIDPLATLRCE